jgi:hypothetical protein
VQLKPGTNRLTAEVTLPQLPKRAEDLVWYRLAYTLAEGSTALAHGVLPLFESVGDFALRVSAPATTQPGRQFFVRVHTSHPVLAHAIGGVHVAAVVRRGADEVLASATGTTDGSGYAVLPMSLAANVQGRDLELVVEAQRGAVKKGAQNDLKIGAPARIFVQTDKPLYQPGQVLHIRGLAFGDEHRALAGKTLYFQIQDQDGAIVFRDEHKSSRFGVVATDWAIPERVKLGEYRIRVKTYPGSYVDEEDDSEEGNNSLTAGAASKTVRISRYDLPTFVVNAKPDRSYYLPGQKTSVEISAAYLFGKPVPKAKVRISRLEERTWNFAKQQWNVDEGESIEGTTDEQGAFRGDLDLTQEFAKLDASSYRRFQDVKYTAYVTDPSSGRTEQRRFDVRITKFPIHVYYVSQYYRGMPDEFFVSTSYADGEPAECEVEVRTIDPEGSGERLLATARTNRYGVARVRDARPARGDEGEGAPLILVAHDRKGATGVTKETLWPRRRESWLRMRTRKTILAPEEPIEVEIRSDSNGEVAVELSNEWKVLRSFTVRLWRHGALVRIPYRPEFTGQLTVTVADMQRGDYWREYGLFAARSVIYPRNRDLKIAVKLDKSEYRPGQQGEASVRVRTAAGDSVPSVIGAVIFDKAVEERARIDQDLREPFGFSSYGDWWDEGTAKLSGLTRADLNRIDTSQPVPDDLDIAADFLLNGTGYGWGVYEPTFGDERGREPGDVYKKEIEKELEPLRAALDAERRESGTLPRDQKELDAFLERHQLRWSDWKDPWGLEFIATFGVDRDDYLLSVSSPGADKRAETDDDFLAEHWSVGFYLATERQVTKALREYHSRNGDFVRDRPSLTQALSYLGVDISKLLDPWGRPYAFTFGVDGARYTVTAKTSGKDGKPGKEYAVGTSAIDYFAEPRKTIDQLLASRVKGAGRIPETPEQFRALLLPELHFDDLRDPYGRPYLVRLAAMARYSDRWVQNNQKVKTEPITIWTRFVKIRSAGPDGIPDNEDDFDVAVFSAVLSEITVTGQASPPSVRVLFTGDTGGISGVVSDPVGAVVANAKVVATNAYTKFEYETRTDAVGAYLLRNLPPGVYNLSVWSPGFSMTRVDGLVVRAQEAIVVNAILQVGAMAQTVEVSGAAPEVNTASASIAVVSKAGTTDLAQQATVTPRLRQYFPETLLWQPSVETDRNGRARIDWKFADNLTTWKLSLIASTLDGRMATMEKEVKSFQPFFVEHDPPKVLTLGDRISLPVVVRNYTEKNQLVRVEMPVAEWFRPESTAAQEASLSPGGNATVVFPFEAIATTAAGKQRVVATGGDVADAIERSVAVHPYGAELTHTEGRIIAGDARWEVEVPAEAIPGSVHADLKLYPDLLAHVTESLEAMLERPWGCGEQTISSTYPSVLLLKFEKQSKRSLGPLHDRALRYVALGYTRLLTYADDSGGFTYWGHGEPDLALTAYAVRFLQDASEFAPVDPYVLARARQWLFRQQKTDGGWKADRWYASAPVEDAILTAYLARVLAADHPSDPKDKNAGLEKAAIGHALDYVAAATKNYTDPYLFASYGLAEISAGQPPRAPDVLAKLRTAAETERAGSFWELQTNTPFYGWGHAGRVETTALVVQYLHRTGHPEDAGLVDRGLEFLIEQKDRYGVWYSTQTTVNVIDALLLLAEREKPRTPAPLRVTVNGSPQSLPANTGPGLGPQVIDLSRLVHPGKNTVEVSGGSGTLATAQSVADYYVPWSSTLAAPAPGPLKLSVTCDHLRLEVGGKVTCNILAERIGSAGHGMMIAEIGVPPGVDIDREGLQRQISESGWDLSAFDVLPDRVIAYVWPRAGGTWFSVSFTPRMAIDAVSAPRTLFDYYNPDATVTARPDRFVVSASPDVGAQRTPSAGGSAIRTTP